MKSIIPKKIAFSLTWFALSVFFIHQLPGITAENSANPPKSVSVNDYDIGTLKNVLRQNNLQTQKMNSIQNKTYSMENKFHGFPDKIYQGLTVREIDVPSVLRILAKEGGKNIVIDKSVQGTISAELKNVSLNEAMHTILVGEELEARVEGNTIFVASRPSMAQKGLNRKFIKAFKLNNSNALDVAKLLEASIFNKGYKVNSSTGSAGTTMQAVPATDSSSATKTSDTKEGETSTGKSSLVDSKTIRAKIEKLNPGDGFSDANKLASQIKLQNTTSTIDNIDISNNDNGAIVIPDTRTNSVLIAGLQEDIALAGETIKYLDRALPQVAIEVSLVEIKKDDQKDLGISLSGQAGRYGTGFNSANGNAENVGLGTIINQSSLLYSTKPKTIPDNFGVRLNNLITNGKAKLLANPNIIALDGSESLIKITDRVISKMDIVVNQTSTSYSLTLEDIGIVLNILPKISDDGYITMRLRPSITTPLGKEYYGPGTSDSVRPFATLISTREVLIQDTRVKSGDTLAIGGLLKETDIESIGKLPYLSEMPVFGKIFNNTSKTHSKTELVILITPKILSEESNN